MFGCRMFSRKEHLLKSLHDLACSWVCRVQDCWVKEFSCTGQLVTLGLVDSSIRATAKGLALVDVEVSIAKDLLCSYLIGHSH